MVFQGPFRLGSRWYISPRPPPHWGSQCLLCGAKLLCPAHCALMLPSSPQVIQKISAVDRDEPSNGHQFYFSLTTDATNNHNFSLTDNKGKRLSLWQWRQQVQTLSECFGSLRSADYGFFFLARTLIKGQYAPKVIFIYGFTVTRKLLLK